MLPPKEINTQAMLISILGSILLLSLSLSLADQSPNGDRLLQECDIDPTFDFTLTFYDGLIQALATLTHTAAFNGFSATTNRTSSVTVLALCRGTLSSADCQRCVHAATADLTTCTYAWSAHVWYDYCMARYSVHNFIGIPNNSIAYRSSGPAFAPDTDSYVRSVHFLITSLIPTASTFSDKRYALGKTHLLNNQMLYGYVDCTRDISPDDCANCLSSAYDNMTWECVTKRACQILAPSCNVQFGMDPLYEDWDIAPLITPPKTGRPWSKFRFKPEIPVIVAVAVVVAVGLSLLAAVLMARRRERLEREKDEEMMRKEGIGMRPLLFDMDESIVLRPFLFALDELVVATDNFSSSNLLGSGGFGAVYRGKMGNGEEIAVKKLASGSIHGLGEFFNEVKVLLNMQHRNLVRLLGCCVQRNDRLLVYEYLPNKSLDTFLFDKRKRGVLNWSKRYDIITGITRGLIYLHEDSLLKIIHRDIKASNILLDEQMNPKISDFGLAKLFSDERSHITTQQIAGTFGYMAPEYVTQGLLSMKSDVFSFGVLILEIISGRKNYDARLQEQQQELLNFAWELEQEGRAVEVVDMTMGSFPEDELIRCLHIGFLCCQERIEDRPTMSCIMSMLLNNSVSIPPPHGRPGYHYHLNKEAPLPQLIPPTHNDCNLSPNSITTSLLFQGR